MTTRMEREWTYEDYLGVFDSVYLSLKGGNIEGAQAYLLGILNSQGRRLEDLNAVSEISGNASIR